MDECHHICARAFSRALFSIGAPGDGKRGAGEARAREATGADVCMLGLYIYIIYIYMDVSTYIYVYVNIGLSATPHRKDGLTECLFWFFGPLAFSASRPASQMKGVKVRCA